MNAQPHHPGTHPLTAARKAGTCLGRLTTILAAVISGLLASAAAATAAFANPMPISDGGPTATTPVPATTIHVVTTGGMAGWQIALIALAAALVAATTAVLADRARTARRGATTA
jgi:hypothetical protein